MAGQKYHCPGIKSSPARLMHCFAALIFLARIIFHLRKKDEVEAKTIVLAYLPFGSSMPECICLPLYCTDVILRAFFVSERIMYHFLALNIC